MRLELMTPAGDIVQPETYNRLFTLHGVVMVFFFLIPSIPAVLGNFLVPMMIGARDLAFPRINLLSWYLYMIGGAVRPLGPDRRRRHRLDVLHAYSTVLQHAVIPAALGAFIVGFSSILTGLNFIVTIHKMRAPGMTWIGCRCSSGRMYATSLIMILGTPVVVDHDSCSCSSGSSTSGSSTPSSAATRSCSSTSSGSTRTRRFTS